MEYEIVDRQRDMQRPLTERPLQLGELPESSLLDPDVKWLVDQQPG